jgi:hypothetical protein
MFQELMKVMFFAAFSCGMDSEKWVNFEILTAQYYINRGVMQKGHIYLHRFV